MMRRAAVLICALCALLAVPVWGGDAPNPRTMTFPQLKFEIPKDTRFVLDNGMVVHFIEDHELPLVSITAYVGTGSVYDPSGKTGLAGLTGSAMRSGGIGGVAPEKLDEELDFMASSIESGISADSGTVSMSTLRKNLDRTLELYAGVLTRPAFDAARVELAKNQAIEGLRRMNDDPKEVAERELHKAVYAGTPLGNVPTIDEVKSFTRDDMAAFHRRFYRPNNVVLAVSGDVTLPELKEKLSRVFSGWQKGEVSLPPVAAPHEAQQREVLLAKKEVSQSVIRMGHLGIEKGNPDLYALRVMDFILGGNGFNSRLMEEIRAKQGLAYNVASAFDVGRRYPGLFEAETETKAASTAKTISLMLEIIEGMCTEPVSEAELKLAKESMINSFIFGFAKTDVVVNQRARLEFYNYPAGYLENYRDNIAKVTREDVLRVAKKYLHPDRMFIVVAGDPKSFDKPLTLFGQVRELQLNGNGGKTKMAAEK